MICEQFWIDCRTVINIHSEQLFEHGGRGGLRDFGMLDSAVNRPLLRLSYDSNTSVPRLAAAYAYGLTMNLPFVDGNKRVALVASLTFLRKNGYEVVAPLPERYVTFMRLAAGDLTEDELAAWFEKHTKPI